MILNLSLFIISFVSFSLFYILLSMRTWQRICLETAKVSDSQYILYQKSQCFARSSAKHLLHDLLCRIQAPLRNLPALHEVLQDCRRIVCDAVRNCNSPLPEQRKRWFTRIRISHCSVKIARHFFLLSTAPYIRSERVLCAFQTLHA